VQPFESKFLHQHKYQSHHRHYNPHQLNMSSLSNTAVPVQDTVTNLASYRHLIDATQMAPCTGVHRTEAPPVNRREAREQLRCGRALGSGPGGPYRPSNPVRGFCSRRSRMEDVD